MFVQFGGDPDHVIVNGVSAGAGSVVHHLTAYGGEDEGLFHGAIAESVFSPGEPQVSELEWQFDRLLTQVSCDTAAEAMTCLRGKDTSVLQAANIPTPFPGRPTLPLPLFYWRPCVDGSLIRDSLSVMFENGEFLDVPVLLGTNNDGKSQGYLPSIQCTYKSRHRGFVFRPQRNHARRGCHFLSE